MKIERASLSVLRNTKLNFPGGSVVKNLPANAGDTGLISGREDPTCCGAPKSMCPNYGGCALGPASCNYGSPCSENPVQCNKE